MKYSTMETCAHGRALCDARFCVILSQNAQSSKDKQRAKLLVPIMQQQLPLGKQTLALQGKTVTMACIVRRDIRIPCYT